MVIIIIDLFLSIHSLRFIVSYNKGQAMQVMHVGVPSSDQIMNIYKGSHPKKVYMHWKANQGKS